MRTPLPIRQDSSPPGSLKGYLLLGLAFVTCPCHLPLLLAILAGTGLAGALSQYFGFAFLALTVVFVVSLVWGLRALKSGEPRRSEWPKK
ncbi:MAG: mercury resistance protein [Candidatus Rokubacteria bacterium]|nr:mercury resistance protein [Candidatus Rokubacteria bacterium]